MKTDQISELGPKYGQLSLNISVPKLDISDGQRRVALPVTEHIFLSLSLYIYMYMYSPYVYTYTHTKTTQWKTAAGVLCPSD